MQRPTLCDYEERPVVGPKKNCTYFEFRSCSTTDNASTQKLLVHPQHQPLRKVVDILQVNVLVLLTTELIGNI